MTHAFDLEQLSILVVDDMKSMRLTIRKMLKSLNIGSRLQFAENGKQGLDILRSASVDLVILDWNMPVMNGIQMLEEMRNDPGLRDLPVLMVTAEAERDIVAEVAEIEVDGYLIKPLTLESLDNKIKSVANRVNNPDPVTRHRRQARDLEEKKEYHAAIEQVQLALSYKPNASRLLRQLGLLHFKIKKNSIAEKCLIKAVAANKQDIISRVYLADYYLKTEDLEKAGQYYLEVLKLSTRYNDRAFDIGKKMLKNGLRSQALSIFTQVVSQSKGQIAIRDKIVEICLDCHEIEYPRRLLEESIKENPSNTDMIFKAGMLALEAGDHDQALKYFTTVDRSVRGHVAAKFQLAKLHIKKGKILKADDLLNQILRIEPDHQAAFELRREI